jgi:MscS family membrane protein
VLKGLLFAVKVWCLVLLWGCGSYAAASQVAHPLAPPDLSSPRATLKTFINEMNIAVVKSKADRIKEARAHVERAMRCLNMEMQPSSIRDVVGFDTALYLKETLDRIAIPPYEQIPDTIASDTQKFVPWTLPETEITIAPFKDDAGVERFLFTPDTVKHSELFYQKVKNLPYKPGCVGALYEQVIASGGLILPRDFIEHLPRWTRFEIFGQALWQWIGLALYFVVGMISVFLMRRCACSVLATVDKRTGWSLGDTIGGLILPIALVLFASTGLWFTVYGLHFLQADVYVPMAFVFLSISYFGTIWLIGALLSRSAALVIALGGFETGSMHAPLIRFCFDVVTAVIVVGAALNLGARLGLPTYSLVTGLGIGGLAVALAGRETLSNLIGTIMILLDQPFKLGDFIQQGDGDRGTVTEIGLRSTRIRTRDGILVSIPNDNIANMRIVNESAPVSEARLHLPVGVAYGSSLKEVDEALLAACMHCDYVAPEPPPSVRLVRFGDSSLEFELLVWVKRPEYRGRATDKINRAIVEEFRGRGIEMPFPQRDIRIRSDLA